jgi:folate-binding protein YgfZ
MGAELTDRTIPAEAGILDRTVSFTKGCYTGQELVARIDSRGGNVPRRLRGVILGDGATPPAGATITADGKEVGRLTSVAFSPRAGAAVALAYVRRAVETPADVVVEWDGGSAPARVEALPLVP